MLRFSIRYIESCKSYYNKNNNAYNLIFTVWKVEAACIPRWMELGPSSERSHKKGFQAEPTPNFNRSEGWNTRQEY